MISKIDKNTDFYKIVDNIARYKSIKSNLIYGNESILAKVKVTISIPTYDRVSTLKDAIASALTQEDFEDYCILIIDNNPTRGCESEKYIKSLNSKIVLYYKNSENIGMFGNQNRCFELPKSDWVLLLHDDDILLPNYLKECITILDKNPSIDGLQPAKQRWHEKKESLSDVSIRKKIRYRLKRIYDISMYRYFLPGSPTCGLFRKDAILACGGFNPDYYPTADYCLATIFSEKYKMYTYNKILALYRIGVNESTKPEVLSLFIYNDWFLRTQICKKYKFSKVGRDIIIDQTSRRQEINLRKRYNPDFTFDFSKLNIAGKTPYPIYLLAKIMYRLYSYLIILLRKK